MRLMDRNQALDLVEAAHGVNPGPWREHSLVAERIAQTLASHVPGLDPQVCGVHALLHDIGRIGRNPGIMHALDGYRHLVGLGYPAHARYCITHCFPGKHLFTHSQAVDDQSLRFLAGFLEATELGPEDRIIQLADMLASPHGPMVMEVRLMESGIRNRFSYGMTDFWQECLVLKREVDGLCGGSVYRFFDDLLIEWPAGT